LGIYPSLKRGRPPVIAAEFKYLKIEIVLLTWVERNLRMYLTPQQSVGKALFFGYKKEEILCMQ